MTKREKIQRRQLEALEAQVELLAQSCLMECAGGRWGLFGQNSSADPEDRYWAWPEAKRLREMASEILALQVKFGATHPFCQSFLIACKENGANTLGEPRLAALLLEEFWPEVND